MSDSTTPRFYVYVLCRPNGNPFYVGKGSGDRVFRHDAEARSGHDCHRCNVIRKIWRLGGQVQRYIMLETDDEQEAFAYEIELIAMYGRGTLTNQTDGGEGVSGASLSEEARAKISLAKRRDWQNADFRARHASADDLERRSARMKERWQDPIYRKRVLTAMQPRYTNPEYIKKLSEANKRRGRNEKISAENRRRWQDPEYRERILAKLHARTPEQRRAASRSRTPESLASAGEKLRDSWQDPEIRAKRIAGMYRARATPEQRAAIYAERSTPEGRAKRSEALKAYWAKRKAAQEDGTL